jgi:hypothetical protein
LQTIPQADTARLAIMGICQTGRLPLVVAASRPIAAALVWYGAAQPREWAVNAKYPRPLDEIIAAVDCPVLGMFGETDHLISIEISGAFAIAWSATANPTTSMSTATRRMAGSTTPCRGVTAAPRRRQPGPTSARSLRRCWRPGYDRSTRMQHYAADIAVDYDFSRNVRHE